MQVRIQLGPAELWAGEMSAPPAVRADIDVGGTRYTVTEVVWLLRGPLDITHPEHGTVIQTLPPAHEVRVSVEEV